MVCENITFQMDEECCWYACQFSLLLCACVVERGRSGEEELAKDRFSKLL